MPGPGRVVLASANRGKLAELAGLLAALDVQVLAQSAWGVAQVAEDGHCFVENALIKARHASRACALPAIADDSGLVIDALGGAPGIHSARYAGEAATDEDNVKKVLAEMDGVADDDRGAHFECVIVYLRNPEDPVPIICQGSWYGHIAHAPRGCNGFGYDPVFYLRELGCTSAELAAEAKNRLSHRAQAVRRLQAALAGAGQAGTRDL